MASTAQSGGTAKVPAEGLPQLPDGSAGVRLGSGVVVRVLGEGGAAVVYEVHNKRYGVRRAVKLLKPGRSPESRGRFERETRIMPLLRHPNIVRVCDIGRWQGLPYIEMERVNGLSLDALLAERGALPLTVALAIGIAVCQALAYVHTHEFTIAGRKYRGILHRDLKPANVLITTLGEVKLTDFGAARTLRAVDPGEEELFVGSLQYVAPEELRGEPVDQRSDIFSVGCVLYEMLTGGRVFPQSAFGDLLDARLANRYRPLPRRPWQVPRRVRELVERCLAPDPAGRPKSVDVVHGYLTAALVLRTRQTIEHVVRAYVTRPSGATWRGTLRRILTTDVSELLRGAAGSRRP